MAHGHRGVAFEQHHGHRTPDHEAAAHHRHALARDIDAVGVEHLEACRSRAGRKAFAATREHARQRRAADAVDVFRRIEGLACGLFVVSARKRTEHQAAVNAGIAVDLRDDAYQRVLARVFGQHEAAHLDTQALGALERRAFVRQVVFALAHAHDRKRRHDACGLERFRAADRIPLSMRR